MLRKKSNITAGEVADLMAAAPLLARRTVPFLGFDVSEKMVGTAFFRLLLAHSNYRQE